MTTTTLYKLVESELFKRGFNEFVNEDGELVFFDEDHQMMTKIYTFDDDVSEVMDNLFSNHKLNNPVHDTHFKKAFMYHFIDRQINRQTVEMFKMKLYGTFMIHENYINSMYSDIDKYLRQQQTSTQDNENKNKQTNKQNSKQSDKTLQDGRVTSDNRNANSTLPQNNVQLDVNSTIMTKASSNDISRNKQTNIQDNESESESESEGVTENVSEGVTNSLNESYNIDTLFKTNGMLEKVFNEFDKKCFLQIW